VTTLTPAEGKFLPLASRELHPVLVLPAEMGLQSRRQRSDNVGGAGPRERIHDPALVADPAHVAEADRLTGHELEVHEVLHARGDPPPPFLDVHISQIDAVDGDPSLGGLVEAREKLDQGGLAGSVVPDDRYRPPGRDREVDVSQDVDVRVRIAECDAFEPDAFPEPLGYR